MTLNDLIGPAVVAAFVSGVVTILGNVFSIRSSRSINFGSGERPIIQRRKQVLRF